MDEAVELIACAVLVTLALPFWIAGYIACQLGVVE